MIKKPRKNKLIWKYELTIYLGGAQLQVQVKQYAGRTGDKVKCWSTTEISGHLKKGQFPPGLPPEFDHSGLSEYSKHFPIGLHEHDPL